MLKLAGMASVFDWLERPSLPDFVPLHLSAARNGHYPHFPNYEKKSHYYYAKTDVRMCGSSSCRPNADLLIDLESDPGSLGENWIYLSAGWTESKPDYRRRNFLGLLLYYQQQRSSLFSNFLVANTAVLLVVHHYFYLLASSLEGPQYFATMVSVFRQNRLSARRYNPTPNGHSTEEMSPHHSDHVSDVYERHPKSAKNLSDFSV